MRTRLNQRGWMITTAAAAGLLLAWHPLAAQQADGPGWQAWLGCWETAAQASAPSDAPVQREILCVVPADRADAVEIVSVADGEVASRYTLRADGERHTTEREGCTGWESAAWSSDRTRVYLSSEFTCEGGVRRTSSGIMAFTPGGDWLDVQSVSAGGNSGVQVARYRAAASQEAIPAELRELLTNRALASSTARVAAAGRIDEQDVIEASGHLDALALEAWLLERDQPLTVDARVLGRLADARVPTRVIDLLVALSYPEVFAVDNSARETPTRGVPYPVWDPWWGGGYYGGYYPYGRRYGGWYGGYPAVIVVRQPGDSGGNGGKVVKGEGYRRGGDNGGRASGPTSRPSSGDATRASGGGRSSGGSSGTPARTARPKD